jgi:hypothetical protein
MKYLLGLVGLVSMILCPILFINYGIDGGTILTSLILIAISIASFIFFYKDLVGWDKFKSGLSLKRKR